jgi:peptide/nickel transport system substrate-binding protein
MNILQNILYLATSFILAVFPTQTYSEGVVGQPVDFLPHKATTQQDKTISGLIYRGLFKYDIYGNIVPDLAESWAITDNNTVYTVKLKNNLQWSDGTPISADDMIYTAFKHPILRGVATDKVNDLTVRYTLPNAFSPFLNMLTTGVMKDGSEENYDPLRPVSSGSFIVVGTQRSGPVVREITLYNREEDVSIRKIKFKYYSNEDEIITAAKLGEIDGFITNSERKIENFSNYKFPLQGVYFALFLNLEDEALSDLDLRKKLEGVLDKEALIFDKGIFVQGPISRSPFTDVDIQFDVYDEDLRDNLGNIEIEITIPDIKRHSDTASQIKSVWESKLGVDVKIKKVDPENFLEEVIIPRNYQVLFYGQEITRDPDRYINWHSTQKSHPGLNLSNFDQVRADRALEEGRNEIDNDARFLHYGEFQKSVNENVPAIFLYHPYRNYYVSRFVRGIGEKYTFLEVDRFLDFNNWRFIETN